MSTFFSAYIPLIGQDQDAPPIANDKFLIVCDGLGGDGSAKHNVGSANETEKSAYLGSRILSKTCTDFFEENYDELLSEAKIKDSIGRLKNKINENFTKSLSQYPKMEDSKGGMVFPTTLAGVVYKEGLDFIDATVVWAGDSRVYMLTDTNWLQQLSKDDIEGEFDACFGKDCRMSNCVSYDKPFVINYACYKLPKRCIVFACSDGCFDFTNSPMQFEMKILESLFNAKEIDSEILSKSFSNVFRKMKCGDDCTLSGVVFKYGANEVRASIRDRVNHLMKLISDFKNAEQIYERTTKDKKVEIRTLTSENKKLNQDIVNQQRNIILSAFKEEVNDEDEKFKEKNLLTLSLLLKSSYQPYADYLLELQKFTEKVKSNQQLVSNYKVIYEKLKNLVDTVEREKRIKDRKDKWNRNPIYNAGQQFISSWGPKVIFTQNSEASSIKRSECVMYIEELEGLLCSIKQNIEGNTAPAISEQLTNLTNNVIRTLQEIDTSTSQNSFFDEKIKASILSDEELNKKVMPYIIKNGVTHYRSYVDEQCFGDLLGLYDEYKKLGSSVSAINPAEEKEKTFAEKVKDFETTFLKVHMFKMIEYLVNFDGINSFIPALAQYQANMEKLNSIQSDLDSGKDSQRQVWLKYKDNYEFYKTCSCIGEV